MERRNWIIGVIVVVIILVAGYYIFSPAGETTTTGTDTATEQPAEPETAPAN